MRQIGVSYQGADRRPAEPDDVRQPVSVPRQPPYKGVPVKDETVTRLSPLGHAHVNFPGRYAITASVPAQGLRQLGEVPDLPGTAG
jgi:hypothetical protein